MLFFGGPTFEIRPIVKRIKSTKYKKKISAAARERVSTRVYTHVGTPILYLVKHTIVGSDSDIGMIIITPCHEDILREISVENR